jgi:hypothetical protein
MTNGSNRGYGFDIVNASTEPSAYGTGKPMSLGGVGSTTSHVTLRAPNRDVKKKITLLPRFLTLPFNSNLLSKNEITRIRDPYVTGFAQKSGIAVQRVDIAVWQEACVETCRHAGTMPFRGPRAANFKQCGLAVGSAPPQGMVRSRK